VNPTERSPEQPRERAGGAHAAASQGPSTDGELTPLVVFVVATEPLAGAVAAELRDGIGDLAELRVVADTDEAVRSLASTAARPHAAASTPEPAGGELPSTAPGGGGPSPTDEGVPSLEGDAGEPPAVPLLVLGSDVGRVDAAIGALDAVPELTSAATLLITDRHVHDDLADAVDRDRLDGIIAVPWTAGTLGGHARSQLARWLSYHRAGDPRSAQLVDERSRPLQLPDSALLRDLELSPTEVSTNLLAGIERVLGPRPRLRLPPGVRLTHQEVGLDAVFVVLSGSVALERSTRVGDLRLHHGSTGPVVGLLSLAQQRRAYFTARTTTDVELVHLTLEQLDRSLRSEPEVVGAMAALSIRALADRLRRAEQLQVEKVELNRELDDERRRLAGALEELEQARLELVEQARFVTLGEMAAGIAHELNNPVSALRRAASYVGDDLERLLASHPDGEVAREAMITARDRPARTTARERAVRRELERALGDRQLAHRLLAAGVEDPVQARRLADRGEAALELAEAGSGLGGAVRNLDVASRRIAELVTSLRAYARPDGDPLEGVDVHAGLEDTLRLTAHRLGEIVVERNYGDLPTVRAHPGQLDQVWTNLLVNAAEALGGEGRIEIVTDATDDEHVRVRIRDDGPGVEPEVLERVFEPRFTTKQGTVRYGLGLGLAIARRIVDHHGGGIAMVSSPGETVVTVTLPVAGPPDEEAA
jgi:two-component system, NtrC family, sensor kinase